MSKGRWLPDTKFGTDVMYGYGTICSECGKGSLDYGNSCPHCGAEMEKEGFSDEDT